MRINCMLQRSQYGIDKTRISQRGTVYSPLQLNKILIIHELITVKFSYCFLTQSGGTENRSKGCMMSRQIENYIDIYVVQVLQNSFVSQFGRVLDRSRSKIAKYFSYYMVINLYTSGLIRHRIRLDQFRTNSVLQVHERFHHPNSDETIQVTIGSIALGSFISQAVDINMLHR